MIHFNMTEVQYAQSVKGARIETAISLAIDEATRMSREGESNFTVVSTVNHGICIYSDFQLTVKKDEIIEAIFSTDDGFIFQAAA